MNRWISYRANDLKNNATPDEAMRVAVDYRREYARTAFYFGGQHA